MLESYYKDSTCTICHNLLENPQKGDCGCLYCYSCIRLELDNKYCPNVRCKRLMIEVKPYIKWENRMDKVINKQLLECSSKKCNKCQIIQNNFERLETKVDIVIKEIRKRTIKENIFFDKHKEKKLKIDNQGLIPLFRCFPNAMKSIEGSSSNYCEEFFDFKNRKPKEKGLFYTKFETVSLKKMDNYNWVINKYHPNYKRQKNNSSKDFTLTIEDYNEIKFNKNSVKEKIIKSFYSLKGYHICIIVYLPIQGGKQVYLSLYAGIITGENDYKLTWPMEEKVTIELNGCNGKEEDYIRSYSHNTVETRFKDLFDKPIVNEFNVFGDSELINSNIILNNHNIMVNGKLSISCSVDK